EDERAPGAGPQRMADGPPATKPRARHVRCPTGYVRIHAEISAAGPPSEPQVGLAQAELRQEAGDLLHLLAGRREDVGTAALVEAQQHRRQLDQLAGRPEDDEDHRSSSYRPRHIPAPWATAYTGVT